MAPRLSGQNCKFFKISFVPQFPKDTWIQQKTTPNLEVCLESLRAMLEYWYIERSLLDDTRVEFCSITTTCYVRPVFKRTASTAEMIKQRELMEYTLASLSFVTSFWTTLMPTSFPGALLEGRVPCEEVVDSYTRVSMGGVPLTVDG